MPPWPRPNILLLHWHDLGRWLACYGDLTINSPSLDALAREAIVFEQAYATAPLCCPARGSLFTGLLPSRHGMVGLVHFGWHYRTGVRTLPQMLSEGGYDSVLVGLQHESLEAGALGFDEVLLGGFEPFSPAVAAAASTWLRRRSRAGAPFFLTVGFWDTHRPWRRERFPFTDPRQVRVPSWLPDTPGTRADIAAFHGAIRYADRALGTVLDALADAGHADDTLVVFTTDHGAAFPRAKGTLYDAGLGIALLVRPPGSWRTRPGRSDALVSGVDLVPTLLEAARCEEQVDADGRSFLSLLRGAPGQPRSQLFAEKTFHDTYDPIRSIRTRQWSYIRNFAPGPRLVLSDDLEHSATRRDLGDGHLRSRPPEELYGLRDDPSELHDLAADPRRAQVLAELRRELDAHLSATLDFLVAGQVPNPDDSRAWRAQPGLDRARGQAAWTAQGW